MARAACKDATPVADTDRAGRAGACKPVALAPAARKDLPPRLAGIADEIPADKDETDRRPALLHENVRKDGTICNTLAAAMPLTGRLRRAPVAAPATK